MSLCYLCPKVVTRKSEVDGRGTFAIEPIRAGEMVAMFGGHIYEVAKLQTLSPQAQVVVVFHVQLQRCAELRRHLVSGQVLAGHADRPADEIPALLEDAVGALADVLGGDPGELLVA